MESNFNAFPKSNNGFLDLYIVCVRAEYFRSLPRTFPSESITAIFTYELGFIFAEIFASLLADQITIFKGTPSVFCSIHSSRLSRTIRKTDVLVSDNFVWIPFSSMLPSLLSSGTSSVTFDFRRVFSCSTASSKWELKIAIMMVSSVNTTKKIYNEYVKKVTKGICCRILSASTSPVSRRIEEKNEAVGVLKSCEYAPNTRKKFIENPISMTTNISKNPNTSLCACMIVWAINEVPCENARNSTNRNQLNIKTTARTDFSRNKK
mmetsp:Transcript_14604/g.18055  ORF Transcript_14604/g.18055 Transcript_14604/m.18055 type:complete len:264 (+) Transcript_14604:294-1085(+)